MMPAAAAILEGMPEPKDLHRAEHDGMTLVYAGSAVLACYPSGDVGMRNVTVAVLRQLGFPGQAVAAVMGLTENYVATLHSRALREGLPGIVRDSGRPRKLAEAAWGGARRWRAEGDSDTVIAGRLGVDRSTVSRRLAGTGVQEQLPDGGPEGVQPQAGELAAPGLHEPEPEPGPSRPAGDRASPAGAERAPAGELGRAGGRELPPSPGAGLAPVAGGALPHRDSGAELLPGY